VGKTIGDKELDLAAKEGTFAFHTVAQIKSFQSMDCTSRIIQKLFEPKFTCAQTKVRAIVVNVLAPLSINQIREELEDAKFTSVMTDSSNHKHTKIVPILVRYFVPQKAVKINILEFTNLSGESSAQLTEHIVCVLEEAKLIDKVVSLSADNNKANFRGAKRRGKNNVFERIRNKIKRHYWCGLRSIYGTQCRANSSRPFIDGHRKYCRPDTSAFPHLYCACSNTEEFL
jgi:hypothetical protein